MNVNNKLKNFFGEFNGVAVSYTHLDVYKRQALKCLGNKFC